MAQRVVIVLIGIGCLVAIAATLRRGQRPDVSVERLVGAVQDSALPAAAKAETLALIDAGRLRPSDVMRDSGP